MIAITSTAIITKTKDEFLNAYHSYGNVRGLWIVWVDKGADVC